MSDYKWVTSVENEDGTFDMTIEHRKLGNRKILKNCAFIEVIADDIQNESCEGIAFNVNFTYDKVEE